MESLGYFFGVAAFVWVLTLSEKVKKLERSLKAAGVWQQEKNSIKKLLKEHIGSYSVIGLEEEAMDMDVTGKRCKIIDTDNDWVWVQTDKKKIEKLIRLDNIKFVNLEKES